MNLSDCYQVGAVGTTVTSSGTASAAATFPTCANGIKPRVVRVVSPTVAYIKFGVTGVTATANDILVTNTPVLFNVANATHFSVIQDATTTAGKVNIVPVEW